MSHNPLNIPASVLTKRIQTQVLSHSTSQLQCSQKEGSKPRFSPTQHLSFNAHKKKDPNPGSLPLNIPASMLTKRRIQTQVLSHSTSQLQCSQKEGSKPRFSPTQHPSFNAHKKKDPNPGSLQINIPASMLTKRRIQTQVLSHSTSQLQCSQKEGSKPRFSPTQHPSFNAHKKKDSNPGSLPLNIPASMLTKKRIQTQVLSHSTSQLQCSQKGFKPRFSPTQHPSFNAHKKKDPNPGSLPLNIPASMLTKRRIETQVLSHSTSQLQCSQKEGSKPRFSPTQHPSFNAHKKKDPNPGSLPLNIPASMLTKRRIETQVLSHSTSQLQCSQKEGSKPRFSPTQHPSFNAHKKKDRNPGSLPLNIPASMLTKRRIQTQVLSHSTSQLQCSQKEGSKPRFSPTQHPSFNAHKKKDPNPGSLPLNIPASMLTKRRIQTQVLSHSTSQLQCSQKEGSKPRFSPTQHPSFNAHKKDSNPGSLPLNIPASMLTKRRIQTQVLSHSTSQLQCSQKEGSKPRFSPTQHPSFNAHKKKDPNPGSLPLNIPASMLTKRIQTQVLSRSTSQLQCSQKEGSKPRFSPTQHPSFNAHKKDSNPGSLPLNIPASMLTKRRIQTQVLSHSTSQLQCSQKGFKPRFSPTQHPSFNAHKKKDPNPGSLPLNIPASMLTKRRIETQVLSHSTSQLQCSQKEGSKPRFSPTQHPSFNAHKKDSNPGSLPLNIPASMLTKRRIQTQVLSHSTSQLQCSQKGFKPRFSPAQHPSFNAHKKKDPNPGSLPLNIPASMLTKRRIETQVLSHSTSQLQCSQKEGSKPRFSPTQHPSFNAHKKDSNPGSLPLNIPASMLTKRRIQTQVLSHSTSQLQCSQKEGSKPRFSPTQHPSFNAHKKKDPNPGSLPLNIPASMLTKRRIQTQVLSHSTSQLQCSQKEGSKPRFSPTQHPSFNAHKKKDPNPGSLPLNIPASMLTKRRIQTQVLSKSTSQLQCSQKEGSKPRFSPTQHPSFNAHKKKDPNPGSLPLNIPASMLTKRRIQTQVLSHSTSQLQCSQKEGSKPRFSPTQHPSFNAHKKKDPNPGSLPLNIPASMLTKRIQTQVLSRSTSQLQCSQKEGSKPRFSPTQHPSFNAHKKDSNPGSLPLNIPASMLTKRRIQTQVLSHSTSQLQCSQKGFKPRFSPTQHPSFNAHKKKDPNPGSLPLNIPASMLTKRRIETQVLSHSTSQLQCSQKEGSKPRFSPTQHPSFNAHKKDSNPGSLPLNIPASMLTKRRIQTQVLSHSTSQLQCSQKGFKPRFSPAQHPSFNAHKKKDPNPGSLPLNIPASMLTKRRIETQVLSHSTSQLQCSQKEGSKPRFSPTQHPSFNAHKKDSNPGSLPLNIPASMLTKRRIQTQVLSHSTSQLQCSQKEGSKPRFSPTQHPSFNAHKKKDPNPGSLPLNIPASMLTKRRIQTQVLSHSTSQLQCSQKEGSKPRFSPTQHPSFNAHKKKDPNPGSLPLNIPASMLTKRRIQTQVLSKSTSQLQCSQKEGSKPRFSPTQHPSFNAHKKKDPNPGSLPLNIPASMLTKRRIQTQVLSHSTSQLQCSQKKGSKPRFSPTQHPSFNAHKKDSNPGSLPLNIPASMLTKRRIETQVLSHSTSQLQCSQKEGSKPRFSPTQHPSFNAHKKKDRNPGSLPLNIPASMLTKRRIETQVLSHSTSQLQCSQKEGSKPRFSPTQHPSFNAHKKKDPNPGSLPLNIPASMLTKRRIQTQVLSHSTSQLQCSQKEGSKPRFSPTQHPSFNAHKKKDRNPGSLPLNIPASMLTKRRIQTQVLSHSTSQLQCSQKGFKPRFSPAQHPSFNAHKKKDPNPGSLPLNIPASMLTKRRIQTQVLSHSTSQLQCSQKEGSKPRFSPTQHPSFNAHKKKDPNPGSLPLNISASMLTKRRIQTQVLSHSTSQLKCSQKEGSKPRFSPTQHLSFNAHKKKDPNPGSLPLNIPASMLTKRRIQTQVLSHSTSQLQCSQKEGSKPRFSPTQHPSFNAHKKKDSNPGSL